MLWLCVYFPQLGLEVCQLEVCTPDADQTAVDQANTYKSNTYKLAQQRGIHIGTSLAAAHSIASDLVHMQRNPEQEEQRLIYLSEVLYGFSSHVSIDSTPGGYLDDPGNTHHSVVLEISASLKLFGGLNMLLKRIYQQLIELRHNARLQVAHTPLAALCAARWQHQSHSIQDTTQDSTEDQTVFNVLSEDLSALATMPLECLALSPRQGESLHNMGLRNCGALLQLPGKELGQRFGKALGHYLQRLTGALPDPRPFIKPPQDFASGVHMLEPCTNKTALLFPIKRLCHEFSHWLIAQQLGVCLLRWEFANNADAPVMLSVRTTRASQSGELLFKLTQLKLERCELPRDVLDIRLHSIELEPWQNHSDSLFPHLGSGGLGKGDSSVDSTTPLTELLDQLRARLGPEVCRGVSVQHNHRPEQACRIEPLQHLSLGKSSGKSSGNSSQTDIPSAGAVGKYRPSWLLPNPKLVSRPSLRLLYGPERLQGNWWQDRRMHRDYYIAQTKTQQLDGSYSWVFCEDERWYVHGYFG